MNDKTIIIERYDATMQQLWDRAVDESSNGTFMQKRNYMDYHSDRFSDYSLVARIGGRVLGVLPANRVGSTVWSHQGLTYGSWLMNRRHVTAATMLEVMDRAMGFLRADGVTKLIYKPIPHIYHRYPAEEDLYALFCHGARLVASGVSATIERGELCGFNSNAKRGARDAALAGVTVGESTDIEGFWNILAGVLGERYGVKPVHSVAELQLLQSRFPENIKLYAASHEGEMVAGVLMFFTDNVAHSQYISASHRGKELKALPLLFRHILDLTWSDTQCRYFDFGISTEQGGTYLNEGLLAQKCGMGGRATVYNTYELEL